MQGLDVFSNGKKKILIVVGGGIRGVSPAVTLSKLEAQLGKPIGEVFNMVAGTSAGSILAASIVLKIPMTKVISIFKDDIAEAFDKNIFQKAATFTSSGFKYLFDVDSFIAPFEIYKNVTIGSIGDNPVMMTFFRDTDSGQTIYVPSAGKGMQRVKNWSLVEVVRASCSAPAFFPSNKGAIDGGVGLTNNPVLAVAVEAFEYLGFKPEETDIFVLGTGYRSNMLPDKGYDSLNIFQRILYVVSALMDDTQAERVNLARKQYPEANISYFNIDLSNSDLKYRLGRDWPNADLSKMGLDSARKDLVEALIYATYLYASEINWGIRNADPDLFKYGAPKIKIDWDKIDLS